MSNGVVSSATGSATEQNYGVIPQDGGSGPVIPVGHGYWLDALQRFRAARQPIHLSKVDAPAVCAVIGMASTLLHETVHLCGPRHIATHEVALPPGLLRHCNDLPRLVASMFAYGMAQRFDCVVPFAATCCPLADAVLFANSGSDSLSGLRTLGLRNVPC